MTGARPAASGRRPKRGADLTIRRDDQRLACRVCGFHGKPSTETLW
jgi:hypothetical protein